MSGPRFPFRAMPRLPTRLPGMRPFEVPVDPKELAAVEARYKAAEKRLEDLAREDDKPPFWNKAYLMTVPLPMFAPNAAFGSFTVDNGTTFFAKGIEAHYECSGELSQLIPLNNSPATLTIPETLRTLIMDYEWTIRDNGTGRDWSNLPLPSAVLRSGNVQGMWFSRGQARLRGGTLVTITTNLSFFDAASDASGLKNITSHSLQFIVTGVSFRNEVLAALGVAA
jgi:hypothetical protein